MARLAVIGAGFSGLSAATHLAAAGHEVHVYEKHDRAGGRARQYSTPEGYVFDMGPSWYWMPGVFENYFSEFGYKVSDLYELKLLDPAFDMIFKEHKVLSIPASYEKLIDLFESVEEASGKKLQDFMIGAKYKYETGMENLVLKPGISIMEFLDYSLISGMLKLQVFSSFSSHVRKYFKDPRLISLMEFPILFLGALPKDTPALYSLMNYAGLVLGTWYPMGGFGAVIEAMVKVAKEKGVQFHFEHNVDGFEMVNGEIKGLHINGKTLVVDGVVASADYHHVEAEMLSEKDRNYSEKYWEDRTMAPSALIYYLGVRKKIKNLKHHNLFFDADFQNHGIQLYTKPEWPDDPLFYVCVPSKTDTVAPEGHENLFLLMPIAPGLEDSEEIREKYFLRMIGRMESYCEESILEFIDYKKSYCVKDFVMDYNAYKGNAYGLANTLMQTAILKPGLRNKKVKNLFYTGQLTVPGPGVPPSLISGKLASEQMHQYLSKS